MVVKERGIFLFNNRKKNSPKVLSAFAPALIGVTVLTSIFHGICYNGI